MRSANCRPAFRIADAAVIFDAVDREGARRQAELGEQHRRGNCPGRRGCGWSSRSPGRGAAAVAQIGRHQARLPVMGMHDVGHEARHQPLPDVGGDAASAAKRQRIVRPVAAVRADDRDCPAGRRDAARRARTVRARRRAPASSRAGPPNRSAKRVNDLRRLRSPPAPPDSRAPACASRCPAAASAAGSAPATSARPPVLISGKISDATDRTVRLASCIAACRSSAG